MAQPQASASLETRGLPPETGFVKVAEFAPLAPNQLLEFVVTAITSVLLAAALAHAKAIKAKLVFAKLDRLTRNVDLLRSLVASDVDLVFCDLPNVPPGPMGRFLLTQMAAVAELEAGLIGERTTNALAAAKARGVKLIAAACPWMRFAEEAGMQLFSDPKSDLQNKARTSLGD